MVDWSDEKCPITEHFTVKDALFLHAWGKLACIDKDGVLLHRIVTLCQKLEQIRTLLNDTPMNVHSMFRSIAYNRDQNINPVNDVHSQSVAADFDCLPRYSIEQVKERLRPSLVKLNIRMERNTPTWVHVDTRIPGPSGREFSI